MRIFLAMAYLLVGLCGLAFGYDEEVCPGFRVTGDHNPNFTDNERVLLCGDPKTDAWRNIPESQAVFNLRNFLQDRGYFFPEITRSNNGKARVVVTLGPRTTVQTIAASPLPPTLNLDRIRRVRGELLTPALLKQFEERLLFELQMRSIGCPQIRLNAFAQRGEVVASLSRLEPQNISSLKIEPIEGIDANVLSRYYAMHVGDAFSIENVSLSTQRIMSQAIVQQTDFVIRCENDGIHIVQRSLPGPPRLVTVGVGANTELGAALKASWKNARLGTQASSIEVSFIGFFRDGQRNQQEASISGSWYYLPFVSRHFLRPSLAFKHDSQAGYEWLSAETKLSPTWTWDRQSVGGSVAVGPALTGTYSWRGPGRPLTAALNANLEATATSHDFELYRSNPRSGFDVRVSGSFARKGVVSDLTYQNISAEWKHLWNLFYYSPPLLVFGVRARFSTTFFDRNEGGGGQIPATLRHFLGSSSTLRGFNYQELPNQEGGMSAIFLSAELRGADLLPWGLQPLLFIDVGKTGTDSFSLDSPLAFSPGLGLRWQSPIGSFRTTVAHGFLSGTAPARFAGTSHWQFYLSYGEEF